MVVVFYIRIGCVDECYLLGIVEDGCLYISFVVDFF